MLVFRWVLPPLLVQIRRLRSRNCRHASRICSTVCGPSPQAHCGDEMSGTLLLYRYCRSPILPVRIWTITELVGLSTVLCRFSVPADGRGMYAVFG
jgi:hypothetical protein